MAIWIPANYGDGTDILVDIDPDNFTGLSDGDPISTGQDSSGNGRDMTAAGSARPTWETNELDGHAIARFDGSDDVADIADTGLAGQPFVLAAVTRFAAPIAADVSLFAGSGWAIAYQFVTPDAGIVLDLGSPLTLAAWEGAQPVTTPLIVAGGYDGTNTLWRATSEQQIVQAALGTTGYPDAFKIGADAAGTGDFAAMDLARLIVANYVDTVALDLLLGYLAWHYGLEATLPPDSPYLSAAPEVETNASSGRVFSTLSLTEFNALPTPTDDDIGQAFAVTTAAGSSDFVGRARESAAGVKEWYQEGDEFQIPMDYVQAFTDLSSFGGLFGTPVAVNLTDFTEVRLGARVLTAGVTGRIRLEYSTDDSSFNPLMTNFIDLGTTGPKMSAWESIPAGARGGIGISAYAYNGNGTEDPRVFAVVAFFRR